jgi:NMD protein affecting ribosome stability and mRNA decay
MVKFQKTCFSCGKKTNELYDSLCEDCFKKEHPPIKKLNEINLKICNSCKKIHYENQLLTIEEIQKMLPNIVKKKIEIDKSYKLNEIIIKNFFSEKNKINFDIKIDVDFNSSKTS